MQRGFVPAPRPSEAPEIDCVRHLLPHIVIAAAERRARSIGVGADRVLICADAVTEEAYLAALAQSLGTSFDPLDRVARADCPLNDNELIQAAAAGLLPLRERGRLVWVVAPRHLTARHLADRAQPRLRWLRPFRLTSSERLLRFVMRHTQQALGRRATDGLRLFRPLMSNAPRRRGVGKLATLAFAVLAFSGVAFMSAAAPSAMSAALCTVFLAAAALRLFCVAFTGQEADRPARLSDDRLPIYTIVCALYREANVVHNLVAAIRALDYPGIMAQTPLNRA